MNILFLGGAAQVSMAEKLIAAATRRDLDVKIFSYELTEHVPIAKVGTVVAGPDFDSPDIMERLREVVMEHRIDVMLPWVDEAVSAAARYVAHHGEVFSPVCTPELADVFADRLLTASRLEHHGISAPRTYRKGRPEFPLVAMPRNGHVAAVSRVVWNVTDFRAAIARPDLYVLREHIEVCEEFTVDCYVTHRGDVACISPRRDIAGRSGANVGSVTVRSQRIEAAAHTALKRLGLHGAATLRYIHDTERDRLLLADISPCLGGDAVCSIIAGADLPGMILDEARGHEVAMAHNIHPHTEVLRFYCEAPFFNHPDK